MNWDSLSARFQGLSWSWERLIEPRSLHIMLCSGLATLGVALLILMRTRWGQVRPLSKCVALSVFAHILFLGYASGTRLIFTYPLVAEEPFVRLSVYPSASEAESDESRPQTNRWTESFSRELVEPDTVEPDRLVERREDPRSADAPTPPALATLLPRESPPISEPDRKPVEPTAASMTKPAAASPGEMPARTPQDAPRETPQTPQPPSAPLERLAGPERRETPAPAEAAAPRADPADMASQLQRLADVVQAEGQAESVLDSQDRTSRADNRQDRPGDGSASATSIPTNLMELASSLPAASRLGDGAELPLPYRMRPLDDRMPYVQRLGGSHQTEAAVQAALKWLAANQENDGRWSAHRHGGGREDKVLGHDRQYAGTNADTGITGLAVLAFLGAGQTHFEGPHRKVVQHALEFLIQSQKENGSLEGSARLFARLYCHGISLLALSEAFAMTGDDRLRPYVERAAQFTVNSQHPTTGGWRYLPGDQGDTSQLGWQLMGLRSAELAGIAIPHHTRAGMLRFLKSVSSGTEGGLASYRAGEAPTRPMTAEALTCRFFLGQTDDAATREAVAFIMREPPQDGKANLYYWYYGSLALFQTQSADWQSWNATLKDQLLKRQVIAGELAGSWDTDTVWGGYGGRVYTTAMAAMCLEVYYRFLPVLGGEAERRATASLDRR